MITVNNIIDINKQFFDEAKLIDENLLHSALSSYMYFGDPVEQVASIYRGIVKNHAFKDGNKRTASIFLIMVLNDYKKINDKDLEKLVLDVANNKYDVETIANKIKKLNGFSGVTIDD